MAYQRKFYVFVNDAGEFVCDTNKTTRDFYAAPHWVSEEAAISAYARAKDELLMPVTLTQVEVPFPHPKPMRYYDAKSA